MIGREYVRIWVYLSLVFGLAESDLSSRGDQVRPPKGVSAAEPAWEAVFRLPNVPPKEGLSFLSRSFGRRTCRRTYPSFVPRRGFRPPKVPPKVPCPAVSWVFPMHVLVMFRGVFLGVCL